MNSCFSQRLVYRRPTHRSRTTEKKVGRVIKPFYGIRELWRHLDREVKIAENRNILCWVKLTYYPGFSWDFSLIPNSHEPRGWDLSSELLLRGFWQSHGPMKTKKLEFKVAQVIYLDESRPLPITVNPSKCWTELLPLKIRMLNLSSQCDCIWR